MKAIVCQAPGNIIMIEKSVPDPQPGEIVLKTRNVGICGTDLHAFAGNQPFFKYPRILGHELCAEVVDTSLATGDDLQNGEEVVVVPYISCGHCIACRSGKTNCCTTLKVLGVHIDGGMQEYFTYPQDLVLKAPMLTSPEKAIVEPLCIGRHAVERADIKAGQWVVVSGCGPIGVGIIWSAKSKGSKIIAIDVDEKRLELCRSHFDVEHTLMVGTNILDQVKEITGGDMAEIAFDATGIKTPMEKGVDYLAAGGKYILVGLNKGDLSFHHPSLHAREITIYCSRNATKNDFSAVISDMIDMKFPTNAYITHSSNYDQILTHFDFWKDPANEVMKVVTQWA